jgi:hypothetical protein
VHTPYMTLYVEIILLTMPCVNTVDACIGMVLANPVDEPTSLL